MYEVLQDKLEKAYPGVFDFSNTVFERVTDKISCIHKESGISITRVYRKLLNSTTKLEDYPELKMFYFQQKSNYIWKQRYLCIEFTNYRNNCKIKDLYSDKIYIVCPRKHLKGILSKEQQVDEKYINPNIGYNSYEKYNISFDDYSIIFSCKDSKNIFKWSKFLYKKGHKPLLEDILPCSFETFLEISSKQHSDKFLYKPLEYFDLFTSDVKVTCKQTNTTFIQKAKYHIQGYPPKGYYRIQDFQHFVNTVEEIHDKRFTYQMLEKIWNKNCLIEITEKTTGLVDTQKADIHLRGFVPKLFSNHYSEDIPERFQNFKNKSLQVHGDRYDYSRAVYINSVEPILVYCKIHNVEFYQKPSNLLLGFSNCPRCYVKSSKGERALHDFVKKQISSQVISAYKPTWLEGKHLDIYIPEYNLAIEYNGVAYHHNNSEYSRGYKDKNYHLDKYNKCKENNINLIFIWDTDDITVWYHKLEKLFKGNDYNLTFENKKVIHKNGYICYGISYLEV